MAPAFKEWAVIVHALLEGEQILDVRKGGLREDGRHFSVQANRLWLYPTAEHQKPELLKEPYRHWIDLSHLWIHFEEIPQAWTYADIFETRQLVRSWKKITAPQTKNTSITQKGMMDQVISRWWEPSICTARCPLRLRNLTAKAVSTEKINTVMMPETSSRKM